MFLSFPLSISLHCGSPYPYIIWGMNNRSTGGHSSKTLAHTIDMYNMNWLKYILVITATLYISAHNFETLIAQIFHSLYLQHNLRHSHSYFWSSFQYTVKLGEETLSGKLCLWAFKYKNVTFITNTLHGYIKRTWSTRHLWSVILSWVRKHSVLSPPPLK
jgi:hypothetical protein